MDNATLVKELEALYRKFLLIGNHDKAQEVLFKIAEVQRQDEAARFAIPGTVVPNRILLG